MAASAEHRADVRRRLAKHAGEDAEHGFIRKARSSARFIEERDPTFNCTQFLLTLIYHLLHPVSILLVWLMHGFHANFVFTFIPLHRRHAMGSVLYPGCFLAGLALYYWHFFTRGEDTDGELLPEVFVRVHVAYYVVTGRIGAIEQQPRRIAQSYCAPLACAYTLVYVQVRQLVIAIKYAYVPPRLFKSMMSASYSTAWSFQVSIMLGTAWMNPAETIIRREIALACSRLQLDASRYSLTVDPRLQGVLHASLAAVMPTRGRSGRSAFLDGRSAAEHVGGESRRTRDDSTIRAVQDSKPCRGATAQSSGTTVGPPPHLRQQWSVSDPSLTAWEKRLHRNTITIEDLATAMLRTCAEDASATLGLAGAAVYFLGLVMTLIPYATLASWKILGEFDTSAVHIAANVLLVVSAFYSLASLTMFMSVALADYLRRARIQFVLFQLTRSISSNLADSGISIFKATALTQFNKGLSGDSSYMDAAGQQGGAMGGGAEARGNRDLQSVIEAAASIDETLSLDISPSVREDSREHTFAEAGDEAPLMRVAGHPPVAADLITDRTPPSTSVVVTNTHAATHGTHSILAPLKSAPEDTHAAVRLATQNTWDGVVVSTPSPAQGGPATSLVGATSRIETNESARSASSGVLVNSSNQLPPDNRDAHTVRVPVRQAHSELGPASEHSSFGPASITDNPGLASIETARHTDIVHAHTSGAAVVPETSFPSIASQVGLDSETQSSSHPHAVGTIESKQHPLVQQTCTSASRARTDSEGSRHSTPAAGGDGSVGKSAAPQASNDSAGGAWRPVRGGTTQHTNNGQFQSPTTTFIARLGTQLGGGVFTSAATSPRSKGRAARGDTEAVDNSTCGLPPVVDVTRPSNAFAWFKLKELLGETGVRFQLRVQVYLGVFALCTLLLDIAALVEVLNTPGRLGHDTGTDILAAAAFVHTALLVSFVLVCITLGAYSNSQADQQAEALTRAELELEEVARDLMLEVEHRTVEQAYGKQSAGGGTGVGDTGAPPMLFAASVGSLPEHATAVPVPLVQRTFSNVSIHPTVEATRGGGNSTALTSAVKHMSLQHLAALLSGIRSAVGTLSGVIRALRVNRDAHPVRIMGFPASYTMARVLVTLLLTAASLLAGNSLTRTAEE